MRIGEIADRVGVTPRTIRYYEELGLLGGGLREKGSHRLYTEGDVERLQELVRLRDLLGLSLDELVELGEAEEERAALRNQWHEDPSDAERLAILERALELWQRRLELVRTRQRRLDEFATELEEKVASLRLRRRDVLRHGARV